MLPTFNEAASLPVTVERVVSALHGVAHEIIVVDDDSADGTASLARSMAERYPQLRCLKRVGRKGLAGACMEGMMAASAPVVAVMDADGQHDETILPAMLERIDQGNELVVATRYAEQALSDGFSRTRANGSRIATSLSKKLLGGRDVSDPMSGFFMLTRDLADRVAPKLSTEGFKILFDLVSRLDAATSIAEVPYGFRARAAGESKLGPLVAVQFLGLLVSRLTGGLLPVQFVLFALVGATGVVVHLGVLYLLTAYESAPFVSAQIIATLTAMTTNFALNNVLTYAHKRLRGWRFLTGMVAFWALCSIGAVANVGVAAWIYEYDASPMLAGLAGALMGSIFNYAVTKAAIWRDA